MTSPERRAQILLRCYPRVWRARYGEEFSELLVDDLAERPRSLWRDVDVVRAAARARVTAYGLADGPVRDGAAAQLVAATASVFFVASALSIWTQLADGWLAAPPESTLVRIGLVGLSIWFALLLLATTAAGVRIAIAVARAIRGGRTAELISPMALLVGSATVLVAGVRLVGPMWPGTRAVRHGGVLSFAARLGWASTDSISTFWLHPHLLLSLPAGEIAWMLLCPIALLASISATARIARISAVHVPRAGGWASTIGGVAAMSSLVTAAAWVIGSQHASNATYRTGTLDVVLIAMMLLAAQITRKALTVSSAQSN